MHKSHTLSVFAFAKPTGRTEHCDYGKQRELPLCVVGAMIADSFGMATIPTNGTRTMKEGVD